MWFVSSQRLYKQNSLIKAFVPAFGSNNTFFLIVLNPKEVDSGDIAAMVNGVV